MWRNMDDRLERRRELLIPQGAVEEKDGGWVGTGGWKEGNGFQRPSSPRLSTLSRSSSTRSSSPNKAHQHHHQFHHQRWEGGGNDRGIGFPGFFWQLFFTKYHLIENQNLSIIYFNNYVIINIYI